MHLQARDLIKRYGLTTALDLPQLDIDSGASFGLVGNNGAGKTTFLRLVLDLIKATQGQVLLDGLNVATETNWKGRTGSYLAPSFLIDYLTPVEYIYFVGNLYGLSQIQTAEKWASYAPFFGDQPLDEGQYIRNLSEGNKKKVGLVAALMVEPHLLILDEPFANLDPTSQIRLKDMLKKVDESPATTLILSSHDLNHVTEVCGRIAVIERGAIVRDIATTPDTLRQLESYFAVEGLNT
ncbi:MAG: ATP-binding cassette domain-containing protein [Candidatus Latescibacteria bacterium]|nr:ATP-binding cassette domain-containing protein [Candidatus Latescibacterota bacterium]